MHKCVHGQGDDLGPIAGPADLSATKPVATYYLTPLGWPVGPIPYPLPFGADADAVPAPLFR
jgi:hypothetical protein